MTFTRASELDRLSAIARAAFGRGSPRVIVAALAVLLGVRTLIAVAADHPLGRTDGAILALTILLVGPFEWLVHRFALHADQGAPLTRWFGVGNDHRRHHDDPEDLDTLLLRTIDAVAVVLLLGAVSLAWALPLGLLVGGAEATVGPVITAWLLATVALFHYEWTHLLIHARRRPSSSRYRRLARHHRRHHHADERRWLGITTTVGDRLFGTI